MCGQRRRTFVHRRARAVLLECSSRQVDYWSLEWGSFARVAVVPDRAASRTGVSTTHAGQRRISTWAWDDARGRVLVGLFGFGWG